MYVRNVKQLLRAAESGFDERRYGFGGILDLLRGAQRDNLLRLERDRQGVLRVFPGTGLQRPATGGAAEMATPPVRDAEVAATVEAPVVTGRSKGELPEAGFAAPTGHQPGTAEVVEGEEAPAEAFAGTDRLAEAPSVIEAVPEEAPGSEAAEGPAEPVGVIDVEEEEEKPSASKPKRRATTTRGRKTVSRKRTAAATRTRARKTPSKKAGAGD
jgi:hypothetical protein